MNLKLSFALTLALLGALGCAQELNKNTGAPGTPNQKANAIHLERDFQRVIRKRCGFLESDQIETVKSPTEWVSIPPDDPTNLGRSEFKDRLTGSSPSLVTGYSTFQIDYSFGALNMHVEKGINVIDYSFYSCDQWTTTPDGTKSCSRAETLREKGTVTLDVSYSEINLDGAVEFDDCP